MRNDFFVNNDYQYGNHINGLKFNDKDVDGENKTSTSKSSFIKNVEDGLEILYKQKETDAEKIALQKELIIDSIYCYYIAAMREELYFGKPSKEELKELLSLLECMKKIADETGNEFIKLQTGFVSILISYIDKNS